jgi:hypothetical protein
VTRKLNLLDIEKDFSVANGKDSCIDFKTKIFMPNKTGKDWKYNAYCMGNCFGIK